MKKKSISLMLMGLILSLGSFAIAGPLQIKITSNDIDLQNRTINFKINKAISVAEIKVTDLDGNTLSEEIKTFNGQKAGTRMTITWPKIIVNAQNFKIDLKVTDINDYWVGFQIIHFYGDIPHEEVIFESGKWDIKKSETPKLNAVIPKIIAMLQKFQKFSSNMSYSLYIAGHTDTVGNTNDNRDCNAR